MGRLDYNMFRFEKQRLIIFAILLIVSCKKDCINLDRCELIPNEGPCLARLTRYYYDHAEKKCKSFTWGGCDGTVPFETLEECENSCKCK